MNRKKLLKSTDREIMKIAKQLRVGYALKRTMRYDTSRDFSVHNESVAEHVFALTYLTQYFLPLEDPQGKLDVKKIYQLIIFHDFGEIENGDIIFFKKTKRDEEREMKAAKKVIGTLPLSLRTIGQRRWNDYEARRSVEAKFVYALDKIEPLFELLDPVNERSPKRTGQTFSTHIGKKWSSTEHYPYMRKFVEVISADMQRRNVFHPET